MEVTTRTAFRNQWLLGLFCQTIGMFHGSCRPRSLYKSFSVGQIRFLRLNRNVAWAKKTGQCESKVFFFLHNKKQARLLPIDLLLPFFVSMVVHTQYRVIGNGPISLTVEWKSPPLVIIDVSMYQEWANWVELQSLVFNRSLRIALKWNWCGYFQNKKC